MVCEKPPVSTQSNPEPFTSSLGAYEYTLKEEVNGSGLDWVLTGGFSQTNAKPYAQAAQSVVLMFLVIVLTVVQFRYVESKVRYQ